MGPGDLTQLMKGISYSISERVLIGINNSDDCGVINVDGIKLLQTVDLITPIVDDPFIFGQIAVANSVSDIYAMGGEPLSALNIACFPTDCLDISILREILEGGKSKIDEAGLDIVGGHTITDKEIKYGLSVLGKAGAKIFVNNGACEGLDVIITKPLGGGILSSALKGELISEGHKKAMISHMTRLNKYAMEALDFIHIYTVTDITGFGLMGHLYEVSKASNITSVIDFSSVPFMEGFFEYINYGLIPAGAYRNRDFVLSFTEGEPDKILMLSSPETSGGLIIFCEENKTKEVMKRIADVGDRPKKIGETRAFDGSYIKII